MLEEHLNCLFYDLFGQDFQILATYHQWPQRELVEDPHELMSRQRRIAAVQDAYAGQMGDLTRQPLGLRLHDGGELLGDPRKLAGVGNHHAQEPGVLRVPVELQYHASHQTKHLPDIALCFNAGRKRVLELEGRGYHRTPGRG